jgi:predicted ABC-type ATPase
MLVLNRAFRLYDVMKPYVMNIGEKDLSSIEFIQGIIHQMNQRNPRDYCEAIAIITGKNIQEVVDTMSTQERFMAFTTGLAENKIISLVKMVEKVGY